MHYFIQQHCRIKCTCTHWHFLICSIYSWVTVTPELFKIESSNFHFLSFVNAKNCVKFQSPMCTGWHFPSKPYYKARFTWTNFFDTVAEQSIITVSYEIKIVTISYGIKMITYKFTNRFWYKTTTIYKENLTKLRKLWWCEHSLTKCQGLHLQQKQTKKLGDVV